MLLFSEFSHKIVTIMDSFISISDPSLKGMIDAALKSGELNIIIDKLVNALVAKDGDWKPVLDYIRKCKLSNTSPKSFIVDGMLKTLMNSSLLKTKTSKYCRDGNDSSSNSSLDEIAHIDEERRATGQSVPLPASAQMDHLDVDRDHSDLEMDHLDVERASFKPPFKFCPKTNSLNRSLDSIRAVFKLSLEGAPNDDDDDDDDNGKSRGGSGSGSGSDESSSANVSSKLYQQQAYILSRIDQLHQTLQQHAMISQKFKQVMQEMATQLHNFASLLLEWVQKLTPLQSDINNFDDIKDMLKREIGENNNILIDKVNYDPIPNENLDSTVAPKGNQASQIFTNEENERASVNDNLKNLQNDVRKSNEKTSAEHDFQCESKQNLSGEMIDSIISHENCFNIEIYNETLKEKEYETIKNLFKCVDGLSKQAIAREEETSELRNDLMMLDKTVVAMHQRQSTSKSSRHA